MVKLFKSSEEKHAERLAELKSLRLENKVYAEREKVNKEYSKLKRDKFERSATGKASKILKKGLVALRDHNAAKKKRLFGEDTYTSSLLSNKPVKKSKKKEEDSIWGW